MKSKRFFAKALSMLVATGFALSLFLNPVNTIPVQAGSAKVSVRPYSDEIQWRYVIFGTKLYKRLFNYSTNEWIGDWIYVRDM